MEKAHFRLIGDVHGAYVDYLKMCSEAEYTLQVGDLAGPNYDVLSGLDSERHRVLAGNHDICNPSHPHYFRNLPHFLGDWGTLNIPRFGDLFYVRGSWSIDGKQREARMFRGVPGVHNEFWEESELSYVQLEQAILAYKDAKPDFVVTHECPLDIVTHVADPRFVRNFGYTSPVIRNRTNQSLQVMLDYHRPKHWIFGHYHQRWEQQIDGTQFTCLPIVRLVENWEDPMAETPSYFIDFPAKAD